MFRDNTYYSDKFCNDFRSGLISIWFVVFGDCITFFMLFSLVFRFLGYLADCVDAANLLQLSTLWFIVSFLLQIFQIAGLSFSKINLYISLEWINLSLANIMLFSGCQLFLCFCVLFDFSRLIAGCLSTWCIVLWFLDIIFIWARRFLDCEGMFIIELFVHFLVSLYTYVG